jgi:hypothetical protein
MRETNSFRQKRISIAAYLVLFVGFIFAMSMSLTNKNRQTDKEKATDLLLDKKVNSHSAIDITEKKSVVNDADNKREEESKQAFIEAYKVFMHPRCMNCHPSGDVPLQGEDSHLHTQGVKRGKDGRGLYAMKCKNCHQDANLIGDNLPPGHPNWHLPPADRKMVFEGKSPRQLAMGFKDPKFTGFNTMDKFLHHIEHDSLVKHSFTYGVKPPLSHADFASKVREWVEKGAALPDK